MKRARAVPVEAGDVRLWTALDADSKLILSREAGDRSGSAKTRPETRNGRKARKIKMRHCPAS